MYQLESVIEQPKENGQKEWLRNEALKVAVVSEPENARKEVGLRDTALSDGMPAYYKNPQYTFSPSYKKMLRDTRKDQIFKNWKSEKKMSEILDSANIKYHRQVIINPFVVDFLIPSKCLIVEVDGSGHSKNGKNDFYRDRYVNYCGFKVVRFNAWDMKKDWRVIKTIDLFQEVDRSAFKSAMLNCCLDLRRAGFIGRVYNLNKSEKFVHVLNKIEAEKDSKQEAKEQKKIKRQKRLIKKKFRSDSTDQKLGLRVVDKKYVRRPSW